MSNSISGIVLLENLRGKGYGQLLDKINFHVVDPMLQRIVIIKTEPVKDGEIILMVYNPTFFKMDVDTASLWFEEELVHDEFPRGLWEFTASYEKRIVNEHIMRMGRRGELSEYVDRVLSERSTMIWGLPSS